MSTPTCTVEASIQLCIASNVQLNYTILLFNSQLRVCILYVACKCAVNIYTQRNPMNHEYSRLLSVMLSIYSTWLFSFHFPLETLSVASGFVPYGHLLILPIQYDTMKKRSSNSTKYNNSQFTMRHNANHANNTNNTNSTHNTNKYKQCTTAHNP